MRAYVFMFICVYQYIIVKRIIIFVLFFHGTGCEYYESYVCNRWFVAKINLKLDIKIPINRNL